MVPFFNLGGQQDQKSWFKTKIAAIPERKIPSEIAFTANTATLFEMLKFLGILKDCYE